MALSFQIESIDCWIADARPLIFAHWQELGLDLDLAIDPDIEKMKLMEKMGLFFVLTARETDKLVGYLLALVSPHLHYKSSKPMLIVDAYYVTPEFRNGAGVRLLKFMEETAHQKGAIKIYLSCKVHRDHSKLFESLGYRLSDFAFIKRMEA